MRTLLELRPRHERDAVAARQAARHVARLLGFEHHDQIRIATAVSELLRAALGGGEEILVEMLVTREALPQRLVVRVTSPHLAREPESNGPYRGDGRTSAQRLLERCVEPTGRPDRIALARPLPPQAPLVGMKRVREIRDALEQVDTAVTEGYLTELKQQNRELSTTLLELERKQEELTRLNAELADTNRGVMALYAELDERANHLRRADEIKTKFLSNVSHEFRTPLNSIRTLAQLLLDQADGPLTPEQLRQVQLIHGASAEMLELVNDLLDVAKVEAGKTTLDIGQFTVGGLFGALRGMMRPLLRNPGVSLEFDEGRNVPPIIGDEGKVAQVLRNFLSNAVKFTEQGRITVTAEHVAAQAPIRGGKTAPTESILFCVTDSGIGIRAEHQELIFEEFTQVSSELQHNVRGTGLGLSLCRKLSALLAGSVWVESEPGVGSRFYLLIPRFFRPTEVHRLEPRVVPAITSRVAAPELPLLVLSEIDYHRRRLQDVFDGTVLAPVCLAGSGISAEYVAALRPEAALIDLSPQRPATARAIELITSTGIPVVRIGAEPASRGDVCVSIDGDVPDAVYRRCVRARAGRVLLVDDDERFRTVLLGYVRPHCPEADAIGDPLVALETAKSGRADALVLDLMMPELDGMTLLTLLREDSATADLPVLTCSSKRLTPSEHRILTELRAPFLAKDDLSPSTLLKGLVEARAWSLIRTGRESRPAGAVR